VAEEGMKPMAPLQRSTGEAVLTPLQRLILTITVCASVPAAMAVCYALLGDQFLELSDSIKQVFLTLLVVSEIFALPVIIWATFKYVAQKRAMKSQNQSKTSPESFPPAVAASNSKPLLSPPTTNPLTAARTEDGSITEEDTQQLPVQRA